MKYKKLMVKKNKLNNQFKQILYKIKQHHRINNRVLICKKSYLFIFNRTLNKITK